jgi:hypothetical protein
MRGFAAVAIRGNTGHALRCRLARMDLRGAKKWALVRAPKITKGGG